MTPLNTTIASPSVVEQIAPGVLATPDTIVYRTDGGQKVVTNRILSGALDAEGGIFATDAEEESYAAGVRWYAEAYPEDFDREADEYFFDGMEIESRAELIELIIESDRLGFDASGWGMTEGWASYLAQ